MPILSERVEMSIPGSSCVELLGCLDDKSRLRVPLEVPGVGVAPRGARICTMGEVVFCSKAHLLFHIQYQPLPLSLSFRHDGDAETAIVVANERSRNALLRNIHYSGNLRYLWNPVVNGINMRLPRGSQLVGASNNRLLSLGDVSRVAQTLRQTEGRVQLNFQKTVNTSACEQNWALLNKHKVMLRSCRPQVFKFLLYRIMHLLNMRAKERHAKRLHTAGNSWPGDVDSSYLPVRATDKDK